MSEAAPLARVFCPDLPALQHAARQLVGLARREVLILTPDLEPERLSDPELAQALLDFLRESHRHTVQVLISSDARWMPGPHALVQLHHRLPSRLQIRQVRDTEGTGEQVIWVDGRHRLSAQKNERGWSGWLSPDDLSRGQEARTQFLQLWQRAVELPDLRRLSL